MNDDPLGHVALQSAVRSRLSEEDRHWRQLRQEMAEALRQFDSVKPSLRNEPNRTAQAAARVFDVARRMVTQHGR